MIRSTSSSSQEIVLPAGSTHAVLGKRGTVLICLSGSVIQNHCIAREDAGMTYVVQVPLQQGESYVFEQTEVTRLMAQRPAHLLCLRSQPVWRVWVGKLMQRVKYYAMITFIRRGVEQSGSSSGS